MKKCSKCKKENEFSVNRHKADGLSDTCKRCSSESVRQRRMRLDVMLKGVGLQFHARFKKLHKAWTTAGHPAHLRPTIINNKCLTKIESKGILRSRRRSEVVLNGDRIFGSISEAVRSTGDSRLYIKWSSDNDSKTEGRNQWRISQG